MNAGCVSMSYQSSAHRGRDYARAEKLRRGCEGGCGLRPDDPTLLSFHHEGTKTTGAGTSMSGLFGNHALLVAEIAKCRVLCGTCHRRVHRELAAAARQKLADAA